MHKAGGVYHLAILLPNPAIQLCQDAVPDCNCVLRGFNRVRVKAQVTWYAAYDVPFFADSLLSMLYGPAPKAKTLNHTRK
jgi:hypothetical protein